MKLDDFKRKKNSGAKITMMTCYDYPSARILEASAIDCVLVGDSVAMAIHGYHSTIMATMEMMVLHTAAVARGLKTPFLISDLPFLSYRGTSAETFQQVKQLLQAGAQAVKLEGGDPAICETIKTLVTAGVPVMGHIGLTPQSVLGLGGYKIQGKNALEAELLIQQADALEAAGCFAIVIECVPEALAKEITQRLTIPTIGIGAGQETNGQVLVWHDALGLQNELTLKFTKTFVQGSKILAQGINAYINEVTHQHFPTREHAF